MSGYNTQEKMRQTMASYVPEFSYEREGTDPGSVLTGLCADMIEESASRFEHVMDKYRVQFLNLFDAMMKEPVSTARGYVRFEPVGGYEGDIYVPAGTQVMGMSETKRDIIFETMHDMSVTIAKPMLVVMTDRDRDKIVTIEAENEGIPPFQAFSMKGENRSVHRLYLCFEELLDFQEGMDLYLHLQFHKKEDQEDGIRLLSSERVEWGILNARGETIPLEVLASEQGRIHLKKEDILPEKSTAYGHSGYFLTLEPKETLPELYIDSIAVSMQKKDVPPDEIYVNGISEATGNFLPFGRPLGLYNEMGIESKEIFSRKGAKVELEFELDYLIYEESLDIPEPDIDYRVIMKKPKRSAEMRSLEVLADYVVWEYKSRSGWKRLWKEEYIAEIFNGSQEGKIRLQFICPRDMIPYEEGNTEGRVRARLIRAENIYKVPAIYKCPRMTGLRLSYSYEEGPQKAEYALLQNAFEERDVTQEIADMGNLRLFYNKEKKERCMYLGFDFPVSGMPVSIYFDLENYSDVAMDFAVEYLSEHGFVRIQAIDRTNGFLSSGSMLLLIPPDMKKKQLYGYEGYFLRIVNYNQKLKSYMLPSIQGIHMNMAKVENSSTVEEAFYIDDTANAIDIRLSQGNLCYLEVWGNEADGRQLWKQGDGFVKEAKNYSADMAAGSIHINQTALLNVEFQRGEPKFYVKHRSYTGSQANLPPDTIVTSCNSLRYISGITNPFSMYGGYDGYTADGMGERISGLLYTRDRGVTERDIYHILSQVTNGICQVKCVEHEDWSDKSNRRVLSIAVLMEEYQMGIQAFLEKKEQMERKLCQSTDLLPSGRKLELMQPHFVKVGVRVWLEKETMEQAYELQKSVREAIETFLDPVIGGIHHKGWQIGSFPQNVQMLSYLKSQLDNCELRKLVMTVEIEGKEHRLEECTYYLEKNPFVMAVNGEHVIHIDIVSK